MQDLWIYYLNLPLSLVRQHVMIGLDTECIGTLPDGERPHISNRNVLPYCAGTTQVLCVSWPKCHLIRQLMSQVRLCVPSLLWIVCLSFLDASQQIKMHSLQIFFPCYIKYSLSGKNKLCKVLLSLLDPPLSVLPLF